MALDCNKPLVKRIRTPSGYYLYDSRSNRLLQVTKRMSEIIDCVDIVPEEEILNLHKDKATTKHAINILRELSQKKGLFRPGPLKARGSLVYDDFVASQLKYGAEMMTLEVTDLCNLRCHYCIFSGGYEYYPKHGVRKMSTEVGRRAIDFYLSTRMDAQELSIGFYGGEPLLNFDLVQYCCEYAIESEKKNGQTRQLHFSITTNGTLLSNETISWLMDKEFNVTVSCDGPAHIHDKHRILPSGKGSFDQVFLNLQEIYEKNPKYYENHILITDLSLKLKRLSRISAKKAIFAANFVKPCPKSSRDSAFSPSDLTHRKSAPLNMGVSKTLTPYIAIWKFAISPKISANGQ